MMEGLDLMESKIQSEMKYCEKCQKFRAFYIYFDKSVCCGCGNEITKSEIKYIEPERFRAIYSLSLEHPSWEVVGLILFGDPITAEEYQFVIDKKWKNRR